MTSQLKRRLAVVLAFDVVGYSRLMESDEEGTHNRAMGAMREVVQPLLAECEGRQVKNTGDGGLAEFDSVIRAAQFALGLQRRMAERNATEPVDRRIQFRIGISLGDIIIEPDDIYGEGVNLAARLQSVAEAGGICVTQTVAEQLQGKISVHLEDAGEIALKNLSRPVRIYRLLEDGIKVPIGAYAPGRTPSPIVAGFGGRPAIAVMPLDTFSHSHDEEYFADGLTEDITTALANWRSFPVISRNSAFTYKGRKFEIKAVGRELGARYLVEGSVRREGSSFRITIQLVEADAGFHIYAEQYDREIGNILGVQDEIATSIVGVLEPELLRVERDRASAAPSSYAAYDLLQRGLWHHYRRTKQDDVAAQELFRKAIAADPDYAQALAALSVCLSQSMLSGWADDPQRNISEALELGRRAVFRDARDPFTHFALGLASLHMRQIVLAMREMEEAVRLNPSYAVAYVNLSNLSNYVGSPEKAFEFVNRALRLSPNDPRVYMWMPALAGSHYLSGRYEQAVEAGRYGLAIKPDYLHCIRYIVAGLGQLGRVEEAAPDLQVLRGLDTTLAGTVSFLERYYVDRKSLEHIVEGLRKAGFS